MKTKSQNKPAIRYSEAFKMQLVRELESQEIGFAQCQRKYGVGGADTLQRWVGKYGNGSIGKVIRVEKPKEINEKQQLKRRVRALEQALADTNIDLALERQYTRLACERAGIEDVAEFKKKAAGQLPTKP
jgi:transposase-like protein